VFQLLSQTIYTHAVEREDLEVVLPRVPNPEPRPRAIFLPKTLPVVGRTEDGGWSMEYGSIGNAKWEMGHGNGRLATQFGLPMPNGSLLCHEKCIFQYTIIIYVTQ